jgi:hypothetical protein
MEALNTKGWNELEKISFLDLHYHADPDLYQRRYSNLETGKTYQDLKGMVLLQNHLGSSFAAALAAQEQGLPVQGSLILNHIAGGVKVETVQAALCEYQRCDSAWSMMVSFPTITGRKHISKLTRNIVPGQDTERAFAPEVVSERRKLKVQVLEVLKMGLDHPIVFASGHASKEEVFLLAEACYKLGLKKFLVTQPANPMTGLKSEELRELAIDFSDVFFEQTALTYLLGYQTWEDFQDVMRNLPRTIYSSDLGQPVQPNVQEWRNQSEAWFQKMELSSERILELTKYTPIHLMRREQ